MVIFKIYDEDQYKTDDYLGFVSIDISQYPIGKEVVLKTHPITNEGNYKANSTIDIGLKKTEN
jgi:hypothetical protein